MFEGTLKKVGEAVGSFAAEVKETFTTEADTTANVGGLKVVNIDGHVALTGSFKSLTINGKEVRFKGTT